MRIYSQELTLKVAPRSAYATQRVLERFCLLDCVRIQQVMDALIGSDKRHAIEDFKSFLGQAAGGAKMNDSQSCFVNKLHAEARGKLAGGRAGPLLQKVPGA